MGMKRFILFSTILLSGFTLRAANPSFTDLVQTNILWVAKNGNNSTAKPGSPALKYASISNAVQAAVAPAVVRVAPGVYNESVLLRNNINLEVSSGVIVSQSVTTLPVIFDNGTTTTNVLDGPWVIIHSGTSGSGANGVRMEGPGSITIPTVDIQIFSSSGTGIRADGGGRMIAGGRIRSSGAGINMNGGINTFRLECYATNDYSALLTGPSGSNYISGLFHCVNNSAVHIGDGYSLVENAICSTEDDSFGWAVEHGGGSGTIRNSVLLPWKQEAIGKYAGDLLIVDGCQLFGGTNSTYSIDNDSSGSHGSLYITGGTWANKTANPAMNIIAGSLQVSNVLQNKQEYIISAATKTNAVFSTNGSVTLSNTLVYVPATVAGAGNGNTNYTLQATSAYNYLGSSNVNISAVMQGVLGQVRQFTVVVTNLSADTWGFQVSSVTNRWRFFSAVYGTNAPVTLTNNTALLMNCKADGTNVFVNYEYYRPGL